VRGRCWSRFARLRLLWRILSGHRGRYRGRLVEPKELADKGYGEFDEVEVYAPMSDGITLVSV
jgi:ribosomal protein L32E